VEGRNDLQNAKRQDKRREVSLAYHLRVKRELTHQRKTPRVEQKIERFPVPQLRRRGSPGPPPDTRDRKVATSPSLAIIPTPPRLPWSSSAARDHSRKAAERQASALGLPNCSSATFSTHLIWKFALYRFHRKMRDFLAILPVARKKHTACEKSCCCDQAISELYSVSTTYASSGTSYHP
jgi:hypothetical protein